MIFLSLWNQWPSWIRWGINSNDWLRLALKYTFGHYVCIRRKGVPAACKGFSLDQIVLINDLILSLSNSMRVSKNACCSWFCVSSFWCSDMAQESSKGINELLELGSASWSIVNTDWLWLESNWRVDGVLWCNSKGQLGWTGPFPSGNSSSGFPVLGERGQYLYCTEDLCPDWVSSLISEQGRNIN